jgi:hypothetical protein
MRPAELKSKCSNPVRYITKTFPPIKAKRQVRLRQYKPLSLLIAIFPLLPSPY